MANFDDWDDASASSGSKNPFWNPCTYKDSDGETVNKKKSENSYVVGYYAGMRLMKSKLGKDITVHDLVLEKVGQESDFDLKKDEEMPVKGTTISLWGKTQLDASLTKNVVPGQLVAIIWTGKTKTKDGSRSYHNFDVRKKDKFLEGIATPKVEKEQPIASTVEVDPFGDDDDNFEL
jgi:hypothetical protein